MKRSRFLLLSVSLVLLLAGLFLLRTDPQPSLSLGITACDAVEEIRCQESEEGFVFYLPAYADLNQAVLHLDTETTVRIGDEDAKNGMSCAGFSLNTPYSLEYSVFGASRKTTLRFVRSAGIASMHIDTQSGSMDYIHARKDNEEPGSMRIFSLSGATEYAGTLKYIRGRGNSTWDNQAKKPYNIRLNSGADLLGMGEAEKWVLLANAQDPSHMRNKIVYDFAAEIGLAYAPSSCWVDLYLNGEYAGLYQLCERNEVMPGRVEISPEKGVLVSQELGGRLSDQGYLHVNTLSGQSLRVHYPEDAADLERISQRWQSVENAILAPDGIDPVSGKNWQQMIDLDSWARKYLIEEIFGNIDACAISQFFYYEEDGGKVFAGPVWDYDYSMGSSAVWQLTTPRAFYANRLHVRESVDAPWFHALYAREEFNNRLVELYQQEFLPAIKKLLDETIDGYVSQIDSAARIDRQRWNLTDEMGAQAEYIKDFLFRRVDFLSSVWLEGETYCQVRINRGFDDCYGYYSVLPGESLGSMPVLPEADGQRFAGWYLEETDEPFDPDAPIYEDTRIYAKWEGSSDTMLNRIGKLIPLGIISILCILIIFVEFRRNLQGR